MPRIQFCPPPYAITDTTQPVTRNKVFHFGSGGARAFVKDSAAVPPRNPPADPVTCGSSPIFGTIAVSHLPSAADARDWCILTKMFGKPGSMGATASSLAIWSGVSLMESDFILSLRCSTLRPPTLKEWKKVRHVLAPWPCAAAEVRGKEERLTLERRRELCSTHRQERLWWASLARHAQHRRRRELLTFWSLAH